MKKLLGLGLFLGIGVLLFTGCTKVGTYQEGTYFGYDEDSNYTAVVYVDSNGDIKSIFLDAPYIQYDNFNECPEVNKYGNIQCVPTTKQILGDDYAMAKTEDDKEWYEQADTFADKVIEEQGLSWVEWEDDEETELTTDALSGVTISADGMYNAVNSALEQAK